MGHQIVNRGKEEKGENKKRRTDEQGKRRKEEKEKRRKREKKVIFLRKAFCSVLLLHENFFLHFSKQTLGMRKRVYQLHINVQYNMARKVWYINNWLKWFWLEKYLPSSLKLPTKTYV